MDMNLIACALSLFMLHACTFSPSVSRGVGRISARILRPGHVPVFMNDAKMITLTPNTQKPITISTTGLIGCTATVLYAKDKTNHKHAILTHYSPACKKEQLMALEQQTKILRAHMPLYDSMKFLIIMPEESFWCDQPTHNANCLKMVNELKTFIKEKSGHDNIQMLNATYSLPSTGKGYTAEVFATLSNDTPSSFCMITDWKKGHGFELE